MLVALTLLSRCSSAPDQHLSETERAVNAAQESEVQTYAPELVQEAEQALEQAKSEIQEQNEEWFFSRDYTRATQLLDEAARAAEQAKAETASRKEQVRRNAESAEGRVAEAVESARTALDTAPRGKGSAADLEAFARDLSEAESLLQKSRAQLQSEDYSEALETLQDAEGRAAEITRQIDQARH